jgi:MFS family permease
MAAPSQRGGGKAIASLVLGILGLIAWVIPILGLIMGVLAIIFGSLTLKSSRKGFAIAGLILGSIVVLISLFAWVYNVQQIRQEREKNPTAIIESLTAKVNY